MYIQKMEKKMSFNCFLFLASTTILFTGTIFFKILVEGIIGNIRVNKFLIRIISPGGNVV